MAKLTKVEYIKVCIKERLKAANHPPSSCELSDNLVKITIVRSLCDVTSDDHYSNHIRNLTTNEPSWDLLRNNPDIIPNTNESANTLINIFQRLWRHLPQPGNIDPAWQPYYIRSVTKRKDPSPREHRSQHISIMNKLMDQCINEEKTASIIDNLRVISKLLSLAYCILCYCHNRAKQSESRNKPYIHLRQFLSDMVITFLLLKSVHANIGNYKCKFISDFPQIEEVEIHLSISPENPVFQELVLQEILEILYDDQVPRAAAAVPQEDTQVNRIKGLAELVSKYLLNYKIARLKTSGTLCRIICNQSRYMATGSPLLKEYMEHVEDRIMKLQKNFVSERTAQAVFNGARLVPCFKIIRSMKIKMDTNTFVILCNDHFESKHCNDNCELIQYPIGLKDFMSHLNTLHHVILVRAVNELCKFLDKPPLTLDKKFWFSNDSDLKKTLSDVVKELFTKLKEVKHRNDNYDALAEVHKIMSNLAISLQYIIYIRWFLCENLDKAGISMNKDGAKHQKVVFFSWHCGHL